MAIWSAVRLQPHRERLALTELARAGFETYCPRILHRRVAQGRKIETTPLLFPGYVFVLIVAQWHAARWVPGVIGFVMGGERPARVPDAVIDELKGRERNGIIKLPEKPKPGSRVDFRSMSACELRLARCAVSSAFMPAKRRATGSSCSWSCLEARERWSWRSAT